MGYDFKVGAAKALRDFIITSLAVGGAAVVGYFMQEQNLASLVGFLPDSVEHALIPVLSALLVFAHNYLKEKVGK